MKSPIDIKTGLSVEASRMAAEFAPEEDFSSVLIQASMDGILAYDLNARYTIWSPSMERISGFKSHEVLGKQAFEVFPFMKDIGLHLLFEATFRGEQARSPVNPFVVPETGAEGFFEQQNFPLFNEYHEVIGGLAIVREVTNLKRRFDEMSAQTEKLDAHKKSLEARLAKFKKSES